MATTGRGRSEGVTGNIEREQGASQEIEHGGPSFESPGIVDRIVDSVRGVTAPQTPANASGGSSSAIEAAARAAAEAAAAARSTEHRKEKDQKIASDQQSRQQHSEQQPVTPSTISTVPELQKKIDSEGIMIAPNGEAINKDGHIYRQS